MSWDWEKPQCLVWLTETNGGKLLQGSIVLTIVLGIILYCCSGNMKGGRRVSTIVNVYAPVEWVWLTFPQQYEMSKIYGVTQDGERFIDGIY